MSYSLYTVQRSDEAEGLLGIARRLFGDEACWLLIYDANHYVIGNNPSVVRAGQQLMIPTLMSGGDEDRLRRVYVVQLSDVTGGLPAIATQLWGTPDRWRELYALNRGTIGDDPYALQPGQGLIIP